MKKGLSLRRLSSLIAWTVLAPSGYALSGTSAASKAIDYLIDAARNGKQVAVAVELKARFDEAANINWAKMLESAGVHVVYGVQGLKTHTKTLLVVRREKGGIRRYSHVGTGNFNPNTARIYEDIGLYTADEDIGADLSELFNHLTGYARPASYRKLVIAPHFLRSRIVERIREQAALGADGRILMKANHIVDTEIIDELYAASGKGCRIDLIVRGNCSVRAGVPGLSETVTLRSIVGRFLEHSRIYRFGAPGPSGVYYIGSADMMQRNLNNRVEALVPVTDPRLKFRIEEVLEVEMTDDVLAWKAEPDGSWTKVLTEIGVDTHQRLLDLAAARARGEAPYPS